jgi:hypothetical protein
MAGRGAAEVSRLFVVLGMHRSGTSLVTKSLECLDISLGDNADWGGQDNPTGHHEDRDILGLNEAVLRRYGSAWDNPVCDLTKPVVLSDLVLSAQRTLAAKLARWPMFSVKDPRMCRLLPFWRPIFERIGCEVSVVRCWRNAGEIALSLAARNQMPHDASLALFHNYETALNDGLRDTHWPTAMTGLHLMTTRPEGEVRNIGKTFGLPVNEARLKWFASEFVRGKAA